MALKNLLTTYQVPNNPDVTLSHSHPYVVKRKRKKNINNDLAVLPSYNKSREQKRTIQLVKYKKYRRISIVYIPMYHELGVRSIYGRHKVC